ncbi:cell cycle progression protein 1-like [Megalops cyprinoides]|uniref:cell cycle progression protein 1-like n=1 Tax=Megalops cyprinoides TaxID=118141 RepID=UPI0018641658|nr:cell cycle progression protein 1-like [Megalops cyprinoides]
MTEECSETWAESSIDATLTEDAVEQIEAVPEAGRGRVSEEHATLCTLSDHSDIVTLEPSTAAEAGPWDELVVPGEESEAAEELYLGTSSSSQYTFSTAEPASPLPAGRDSSSSEDEQGQQPSPALKRRRVRRSTATASETEEAKSPGGGEQEPQEEEQEEQYMPPPESPVTSTLNICFLLALIISIGIGFRHVYGMVPVHKMAGEAPEGELNDMMGDMRQHLGENDIITVSKELVERLREDLEEKRGMVLSLTGIMDKITKENHQLRLKQAELQAQNEEFAARVEQSTLERAEMEEHQKHLALENQQLKSSLQREEESLSALQEELRYLRSQIRSLEERGAGADSVLAENQRLKGHLEEEKQRARGFLIQQEALAAEAQALRQELDVERQEKERLGEELEQRSGQSAGPGGEADPEAEELQLRLTELERKLRFEQQRSDLWERLYVETREERAKGDQQPRPRRPHDGIIGKVKETFDAVKNSTKEFVHHHKEQIKKAKEAVKENLRKFSDSVKSTFRRFKDSASQMFDKTRRSQERKFHERKEARGERQGHGRSRQPRQDKGSEGSSWQARNHKPLHRHPRKSTTDNLKADRKTRKPGPNTHRDSEPGHNRRPRGCSGVFDCAHQESMSLFNKPLDPIREDEFSQLIHSYLQQAVGHFHHWRELESFINSFFHNGLFIHDQMLFTDFVSGVEEYLEDFDEYQHYDDNVFEDLDDYVYKHFFGETYSK